METLKALIDGQENVNAVFVRWETKDLILGSSDLEIYAYPKAKGITLYRNCRLHLKACLDTPKQTDTGRYKALTDLYLNF